MADHDDVNDQIMALEEALGQSGAMVGQFEGELASLRDNLSSTGREVNLFSANFGTGLRRAFDGLVFDGKKLSDVLRGLMQSAIGSIYSAAMKPVQKSVGGVIGQGITDFITGGLFAQGAAFSQGRVVPFAKGGIISAPTAFPLRGSTGLMGEAGPEAIMPLTRGADGRLGVQMSGGGGGAHIVMNITTPDAPSFQRSQSQIAAQAARLLARGRHYR